MLSLWITLASQSRLTCSPKKVWYWVFLHCPFCILDVPLWHKLDQKTTVVRVTRETDKERLAGFAREHDLGFPTLLDPDGILARERGIIGTPTKFAISPDLRVVQVWLGMTIRQSHPAELGSLLSMYGIEPTSLPGSAGEGGRIFTCAHLE